VSHLRRPTVTGAEPVQVTLKLQPGLPSLRTPALKACVEQAIDAGHERFGMRLIEHTLEKDGLSLLVTAPHRRALSRGIQGISVRIARAVNRKLERKGRLFADRYEAQLVADSGEKQAVSKAVASRAPAGRAAVAKTAMPKAPASKPGASVSVPARKASARRKAPARSVASKAAPRSMVNGLTKRVRPAPVARA
jgi:putative transposase